MEEQGMMSDECLLAVSQQLGFYEPLANVLF